MPESAPVPPVVSGRRQERASSSKAKIYLWAGIIVLAGGAALAIALNQGICGKAAAVWRARGAERAASALAPARPGPAEQSQLAPSAGAGSRHGNMADSAGPPRPVAARLAEAPAPVASLAGRSGYVRLRKDWASGMPDNAMADGVAKAILSAPLGATRPDGLREVSALVREICAWRDEPTSEVVSISQLGKGGAGDRFDRALYAALKLRGMGYARVEMVFGVGEQSPRGTVWVEFETPEKRLLIDAALATPKLFEPLAQGSPARANRVIERIVVDGVRSGH